jgi:protease-4
MHKKVATTSQSLTFTDEIYFMLKGEIMGGEGDVNVIGEGSMRRSLQEARKTKCKTIVLRIDSPEAFDI